MASRRSSAALRRARVLVMLGASATTDHISPSGEIPADARPGRYLLAQGVAQKDFNTYVGRRGNHHVMVRGTFANVRLRNRLTPIARRRLHDAVSRAEGRDDLRRAPCITAQQGVGSDRARGCRLRHRQQPRLGGQGHRASRREGRPRRIVRAHPSREPDRHGRPAARVRAGGRASSRSDSPATRNIVSTASRKACCTARRSASPRPAPARVTFNVIAQIFTESQRQLIAAGGMPRQVLTRFVACEPDGHS